ncbi:XyeB family radical SAM/SPASM peptide maturase [Providencia stuartii]|uniref:cyclophane-forming radical SAM/SPASM peptide maturase XyeB n=1 Tax=Providencia TaxID=586 RepID=UPI002940346B|nr:cyclophane-forming radical SAM/SPASM peptide maturase XyeB [Providencia sp. 2023EL-00965]ELR5299576.1 XyeB family radical SAM/SPASM peptide maturase [Providencia stuartii]MDW7588653.1 cyclophane-forming radical SAM/SPASM peptide maturase XyeB [Providencia sp. 2023EL-00965]
MKEKIKHLEVILKVSERCNINCTYCYVFNLGNDTAINSKAIISYDIIKSLRIFFERACKEYEIETIQVDFHGGEPLMMGKERFKNACREFTSGDYYKTKLQLACQTNAILIDNDWIDIFSEYNISIGVSIDGPKHINDKYRLDKKGRSTYEDTVRGLKSLQEAWNVGKIGYQPGVLCVANPTINGAEIYRHFTDVLKCKKFDFLIPDESHDTCNNPEKLSDFYCSALDEFFLDSDPDVYVRYFHTNIQSMLNIDFTPVMGLTKSSDDIVALTISSEGEVYIDDTLRATNDEIFTSIGNIKRLSLFEIMSSWQMQKYITIAQKLPDECSDCIWRNICGGGRHIQRYSKSNGFNNKSVFCPSIRKFLSRAASHIISVGISEEKIMNNIGIIE